jgi:hypothetical protein
MSHIRTLLRYKAWANDLIFADIEIASGDFRVHGVISTKSDFTVLLKTRRNR